ncbi:SdpI family protein [Paenibacillus sp. JJ1722]|uniref:SdpI family protein n=1 Tax=Paenibacillus sp. JJ1722 TaxID=3398770 RepID=UPI003AAF6057
MRNKVTFFTYLSLLTSLIPFGMYLYYYKQIPEIIPVHFNASNIADRFVNKSSLEVILICNLGLIGFLFMWLLGKWIERMSVKEREANRATTHKIMSISTFLLTILFDGISIYYLLVLTDTITFKSIDIARLGMIVAGLVFIISGNYVPKLRQNKISGVRTKTTLNNEEAWFKGQRYASKVWIVGGFLLVFSSFIPNNYLFFILSLIIFCLMIILPFSYSRKL